MTNKTGPKKKKGIWTFCMCNVQLFTILYTFCIQFQCPNKEGNNERSLQRWIKTICRIKKIEWSMVMIEMKMEMTWEQHKHHSIISSNSSRLLIQSPKSNAKCQRLDNVAHNCICKNIDVLNDSLNMEIMFLPVVGFHPIWLAYGLGVCVCVCENLFCVCYVVFNI